MTDTALNYFLASGNAAARAAFSPTPATPAAGPSPLYFWLETDTGDTYAWDPATAGWTQVNGAAGATAFTGLSDVPASYTGAGLKYVRVNSGATALEFVTPPSLVTAFTALSDVPASYTGQALKDVRVNAGETALEFYTSSAVTSLTGDVTASGPGAAAATIANGAVTYAKMQDVSATARVLGRKTAGAGDAEELTLSDVLDLVGSAAQGMILYRGASAWAALSPGTSGYFLKTNGAGADPAWAAASGGGSATFIGLTDVPAAFTGAALKYLRVNAGETAVEFQTFPTLVTAFTGLSDAPANYTGAGSKPVRVNSGATALEFFTPTVSVGLAVSGTPRVSDIVAYAILDTDILFPSGLTDSQAYCLDQPTASVVFDIEDSSTPIGTVTFTNGSNDGTFSFASGYTIVKGNTLNIRAPADVKSIGWLSITLKGTGL